MENKSPSTRLHKLFWTLTRMKYKDWVAPAMVAVLYFWPHSYPCNLRDSYSYTRVLSNVLLYWAKVFTLCWNSYWPDLCNSSTNQLNFLTFHCYSPSVIWTSSQMPFTFQKYCTIQDFSTSLLNIVFLCSSCFILRKGNIYPLYSFTNLQMFKRKHFATLSSLVRQIVWIFKLNFT